MNKDIVIMPFWVENALSRNGKSIRDCLNYPAIRQCMSLEDLSQFLSMQNSGKLFVNDNVYHSRLLSSWEKSADSSQRVELDSTVVALSYSKDLGEDAYMRLERSKPQPGDEDPTYYRYVDIDRDSCVLVLYPGYTDYIQSESNILRLLRDFVKLMDTYFEFHQVARHEFFKRYLEILYRLKDSSVVAA